MQPDDAGPNGARHARQKVPEGKLGRSVRCHQKDSVGVGMPRTVRGGAADGRGGWILHGSGR